MLKLYVLTRIGKDKFRYKISSKLIYMASSNFSFLYNQTEYNIVIIEESSFPHDVQIKDIEQRTPLHLAAEMGHFSICELLIEKSEDKNPIDHWEMTPLHYAARNNHW